MSCKLRETCSRCRRRRCYAGSAGLRLPSRSGKTAQASDVDGTRLLTNPFRNRAAARVNHFSNTIFSVQFLIFFFGCGACEIVSSSVIINDFIHRVICRSVMANLSLVLNVSDSFP